MQEATCVIEPPGPDGRFHMNALEDIALGVAAANQSEALAAALHLPERKIVMAIAEGRQTGAERRAGGSGHIIHITVMALACGPQSADKTRRGVFTVVAQKREQIMHIGEDHAGVVRAALAHIGEFFPAPADIDIFQLKPA